MQNQQSDVEPTCDSLDESASDLPPAYDALSIHQPTHHSENRDAVTSAFPSPVAGSCSDLPASASARLNHPVLNIDKSLPPRPSSLDDTPTSPREASPVLNQRLRTRKNTSWLSLLPFASSFSTKQVRQSVLSVVSDLVVSPSRVGSEEQKNVHEILASIAETCTEHKLSLSAILQETSIVDHTPMYWAIVNYRQELLVALLVHSRPLSIQTISDIRHACLVSSNQGLFHALRVCRPPFHRTDGIQAQGLRAASDNLLLGDRPLDEIYITQTTEQVFIVSFDIPLWQRRMKAIGQVSIEFIASGRMWSVTFFSTDPSSSATTSKKSRMATYTWHVMVNLLESSIPTYFDSQLVVDAAPPLVPESIQAPKVWDPRSTTFPPVCDQQSQSRSPMYAYNSDGKAHSRLSRGHNIPPEQDKHPTPSSSTHPPPTDPQWGLPSSLLPSTETPPPVSIHLGCGDRKLGRRNGPGDSSSTHLNIIDSIEPYTEPSETPTTKPNNWSEHGVGYTNAVVSSLGDGLASHLMHDRSRYLFPDGTLRGRLEATLVKSASSKDCIIC